MQDQLEKLFNNIRQVIVGKDEAVRMTLTALLARGHILIEDVPGLGKTMLARSLAQSFQAKFSRLQFTPDLLPSDVTGVSVFRSDRHEFEFVEGPVFTDILLADEINRASPRTQSSLLEAMEERQVTVDGETRPLPRSFFVVATQNPIELEGTFPLPEAQVDRFLMRIELGYPSPNDEMAILSAQVRDHPIDHLQPVINDDQLRGLQQEALSVSVSREIQAYIVQIVTMTRKIAEVRLGVSPRGSLALMHAAQAFSYLEGNNFVTPDAVKTVAPYVLSHRLILDSHRESTGLSRAEIVERILEKAPVPTLPNAAKSTSAGDQNSPESNDSAVASVDAKLQTQPDRNGQNAG